MLCLGAISILKSGCVGGGVRAGGEPDVVHFMDRADRRMVRTDRTTFRTTKEGGESR